jgi:hypothetical protein
VSNGVTGVATDTVSALKGTPVLLVMVVLNCVFLAAAAWYLREQQDNAFKLVDKLFDHCLSGAAPPPDRHSLNESPQ